MTDYAADALDDAAALERELSKTDIRVHVRHANATWQPVIDLVREGVPIGTAATAFGQNARYAQDCAKFFERRQRQRDAQHWLGQRLSKARALAKADAIRAGDKSLDRKWLEERNDFADPPDEFADVRERADAAIDAMIGDDDFDVGTPTERNTPIAPTTDNSA